MSDLHAMPRKHDVPASSAGGVMHVAPGRCGVRGCARNGRGFGSCAPPRRISGGNSPAGHTIPAGGSKP